MNIGSKKLLREVASTFCGAHLHNDVFTTLGITLSARARSLAARGDMLVAMMQLTEAVN
jgi:hypothetical protein